MSDFASSSGQFDPNTGIYNSILMLNLDADYLFNEVLNWVKSFKHVTNPTVFIM